MDIVTRFHVGVLDHRGTTVRPFEVKYVTIDENTGVAVEHHVKGITEEFSTRQLDQLETDRLLRLAKDMSNAG